MTFCHLNCHSDRSLMYGMVRPRELADHYAATGVTAACFTDYGNISAAVQLSKECKRVGIKPIYGLEVNLSHDKRQKNSMHKRVVLLAKNRVGFDNLVKVTTTAAMYFYYAPRIDFEVLERYHEGLILLTGDLSGVFADAYFAGQELNFMGTFMKFFALFQEDIYVEMGVVPVEPQRVYNEAIVRLAGANPTVQPVVTGDVHYVHEDDREWHETFLGIKQCKNDDWQYPFKGNNHLRTYQQMADALDELHGYTVSSVPAFKGALEQPQRIADKIEEFDIGEGVKIPAFQRD